MDRKEGLDGWRRSFFLSNGHISPVFYSVLASGCTVSELATFNQFKTTRTQLHDGLPGVRIASGSLLDRYVCSIGAAQAKNNDNHLVYTFMVMVNCRR
jgi:transketolase